MTFTERSIPSGTFTPREQPGGYMKTLGSMNEGDLEAALGVSPNEATIVPQAGNRAFGTLNEEDVLDFRGDAFTERTTPGGTFTERPLP